MGGGKGKGKGKGNAPASGKGKTPASYNTDRLRATDGTGVHGNVVCAPRLLPMSAVSTRMAPPPILCHYMYLGASLGVYPTPLLDDRSMGRGQCRGR